MAGIKNTPLREFHLEMGAKMVPRYGWNMPLHFCDGGAAEHEWTREKASIFDCCSNGKLRIAGAGSAEALDALTFFGVSDMEQSGCREDFLLNGSGGIAASCRICRMGTDDFFIFTDPVCAGKALEHLRKNLPQTLDIADLSELLGSIALHGPETPEVLEFAGVDIKTLPGDGQTALAELDGLRSIVLKDSWSGETGYTFTFNADCTDQIWDIFLDSDIPRPAGLMAAESLKVENRCKSWGSEYKDEWSPPDSGVPGTAEVLASPRKFNGKEGLLSRSASRIPGMVFIEGRRAALAGTPVMTAEKKIIGTVTSGCFCPTLRHATAWCSFEKEFFPAADEILYFDASGVEVKGKIAPADL